jgi:hypothetical protein
MLTWKATRLDETRALLDTKDTRAARKPQGLPHESPSTKFISGMDATALSSPGCVKVAFASCQSKALVTRGLGSLLCAAGPHWVDE